MLASEDEVVQEAAADCLRNIRLLALQRCKARDTEDSIFKYKVKKKTSRSSSATTSSSSNRAKLTVKT